MNRRTSLQKVALYISGAIFAAAFIHLARLIAGFEIIVGEIVVPVRMSFLGALITTRFDTADLRETKALLNELS